MAMIKEFLVRCESCDFISDSGMRWMGSGNLCQECVDALPRCQVCDGLEKLYVGETMCYECKSEFVGAMGVA